MKTIDNRYCMIDIAEHEAKLRQTNERFLSGTMSREDVQAEISRLLGEDNLAYRLNEALMREVNSRLSWKARERLSTRQYFTKREELEEQIIRSDFCYAFFENESTLTEIGELDSSLIDAKTLMLCVISALRTYIDNEHENSPKAVLLHKLYLQLKQQLSAEIPFEAGDGFVDYLASKNEREEFERARETGEVCIVCGSHRVRSKGREWICENEHRFRKH